MINETSDPVWSKKLVIFVIGVMLVVQVIALICLYSIPWVKNRVDGRSPPIAVHNHNDAIVFVDEDSAIQNSSVVSQPHLVSFDTQE